MDWSLGAQASEQATRLTCPLPRLPSRSRDCSLALPPGRLDAVFVIWMRGRKDRHTNEQIAQKNISIQDTWN